MFALLFSAGKVNAESWREKTSSGASSSLNTNFPADFYPIVSAAGRGASSQINF
jgi:hypothetical protein